MCHDCDPRAASRRGSLSLATAGVLAAMVPAVGRAAAGPATTLTADQALTRLKEGNDRYVRQPQ